MKEATGELNMTVITIVIIAALAVIGTTVVVPAVSGGIRKNSCASALNLDSSDVTVTKDGDVYRCCETGSNNCIDLEQ